MATHRIASTPETVRWGVFDAGFPPLITIASGDTVVLECVSGGPEVMPPAGSGLRIPPALAAIHRANVPRAPGHLITGPVAVAGAEPGDMLEVRIDKSLVATGDIAVSVRLPAPFRRIFRRSSCRTSRSTGNAKPAGCRGEPSSICRRFLV